MNIKSLSVNIIFIILILTNSCSHKEFCYDHDHRVSLRIKFDWRDAPEASPAGMVVWFYPDEMARVSNISSERFDFSNTEGGVIKLPPGRYHVITYNNDIEFTRFYDAHSLETHYLTTREGSLFETAIGSREYQNDNPIRPDGTNEQRVFISPDEIWGYTVFNIDVEEDGEITLFPHELFCRYSYEIRNVKNLESVVNMSALLTGMSHTLCLYNESLGDESVTIPLPAYKADETTIRGEFLTFGHHADNRDPHKFGLCLWTRSGETLFYGKDDENFDVTNQIHSAPNPRKVHFIIDGLELNPIRGEGEWGASFEDWNEINSDIVLGAN